MAMMIPYFGYIGLLFSSCSSLTIILIIIIPWMILCATKRKVDPVTTNNNGGIPKGGYKPGHLPEFADPDQKETNTFYDVNSVIAFPIKDNETKPVTSTTIYTPGENNHLTPKTPSNVGNANAATPAAPTTPAAVTPPAPTTPAPTTPAAAPNAEKAKTPTNAK